MTSRGKAARSLAQPLTLRRALTLPTLRGSIVLAGAQGLDRRVERLNVMEVPDILPWVKPHELLLTTAYPLRGRPDTLSELVGELDERQLAGIGIKVGRYIDAVPREMLRRADDLGFPVIRLPDRASFDDILNELLSDILHRQAAVWARSHQTHQALIQIVLTGGGLPEIAEAVGVNLAVPVAIVDERGAPLATGGVGDDSIWQHPSVQAALASGSLDTRLPDRRHVLKAPISAAGREQGYVVAITPMSSEGDELQALENAAIVAALAMSKAAAVAAVEDKFRSDFLHEVIAGRITQEDEIRARCRTFGWDLDRALVAVVIAAGEPRDRGGASPLAGVAQQVDALLTAKDPGAFAVDLGTEVLAVTTPPPALSTLSDAIELACSRAQWSARSSLHAGVSRTFHGPAQLAVAFHQASTAATIGRRLIRDDGGPTSLTTFDELGAYRLLSLLTDAAEVSAYIVDMLGPLAGHDREAVELRRTLQVLLDTNLNVAESARQLHCHYNTLRYRIEKLLRIVGPFTTDPHTRLNLQLALAALRLRPPS